MTQALNEQFSRTPLDFFTNNTFEPPDKSFGNMDNWSTNIYDKGGYDPLWLDSRSTYKEVSADSRVVHADITNTPSGTSVKLKLAKDQEDPSFPIYWLPWASNNTRTIKLAYEGDRDYDPDIFFTAGVNGCTVFVEGDVKSPTVHHLNAMNNEELYGQEFESIDKKYEAYSEVMTDRWSQTRQPVKPKNSLTKPGVLHAQHYMPGSKAKDTISDPQLKEACRRLAVKEENVSDSKITYSGCVFGFRARDSGDWQFWCQQQTKIMLKDTSRIMAWCSMFLPAPQPFKIWPGVDGKVAMRKDYPGKNLIFINS